MALLASAAALAISVAPAAASEETHWCWEKELGPEHHVNPPWYCSEPAGAADYAFAVHAYSSNTAFCLYPWQGGTKQCAPAGTWIDIDMRNSKGEPTFAYPQIVNLSGNQYTKVKGITVHSGGGGTTQPPPTTPPHRHEEQLGGEFLGKPTIDATKPDYLNILVRGLDGNLWQKYTSGPGSFWSAWQNVSALSGSGPIGAGPGSTAMNANRLDAVATMPNSTVGHWHSEGGGPWQFESMGGEQILGEPDIASANNGYLDVVARGLDGNLWMKQWNNGYWGAWSNISAIVGGPIASSPGIVSAITGTLTIVARKPNNQVGVWSASPSGWTYQELAGEIKGDPDIAAPVPGSPNVNIVAQGLDNRLWQIWTTGIGWSGWQLLSAGTIGSSPAAAGGLSESNVLDVVARNSGNQLGVWRYGK
jgi:hypothetical protein